MLISAAVFSANASAVQIGAITIDNLREPVAGNTPDYEVKVTNGAVDLYQSAHSTENGIIWRKIVNGAEHTMKKTDVFEYGKTYSVRIYVKRQTDEDFFANSIIGKIGNGFGNYVTAEARKLSSDPAVAVVSYEFECNKTAINSVAVTGITEPVPEARMNFDVTPGTNDLYDLSQDGRFVFWVDAETGNSYNDNQINEFAEGKVYIIQIYIEAKSGYDFPDNPEKVIATVNGHSAELKYDEKNSLYFIQKRFDPCGSVENIEINYAAPVVGQSPSFDKVVNYRYTSTGTGTYKTNGITWYDETAQKHLIKGTGQKFESHHVYTVTFELESEEYTVQTAQGNDYKYYEFINSSATINGELVDDKNISLVTGDRAWKYATVKYTFAALDECSPAAVSKKEATCTEKGNVAYYECTCGKMYEDADGILEITDKDAVVIPANGHKYDNDCDTTCNNCSYTRTTTHKDGTATCKVKAKCTVCGKEYGSLASHDYKAATCTAPKTCKVCKATTGKALGHKYTNACDTTCNTCSAKRTITHDYKAATCTAPKTCKVCKATTGKAKGHKYTNACDTSCNTCKATRKITHSYKSVTTKATLTKNGKVESKCTVCGNVSKTTTVYYPKTIKLSATKYTYNGKAQTPSVTVKDSKGNTLKKDTDYTVKYASGRKNTGKYAVTITFKGKYTGTKKLSYTIAPKSTSKITASQTTTTIKLTWSKVTGATGYRVYQYNTKTKKWDNIKTLTGTSFKVEKLKAGTSYKFRVKAYKKDDSTIWSAAKDITTATKTATSKITKLTTAKTKASLVWSDVAGESGYEVYYSTKKDSGYKKLAAYKTNVVKGSKSKLTSKKTYYFKVRAYTKTANGTVYSAWSSVKSIKVK